MSGGRTGTERMTEKVDEIGKSGRVVQNLKYHFALLRTKPHNKGTLWSTAVTDLDVAKASGPTGQFCGHTFAPQCVRGHLFEIGVSESPHKGPMRARTAIKPQPREPLLARVSRPALIRIRSQNFPNLGVRIVRRPALSLGWSWFGLVAKIFPAGHAHE
jgi:hypothetical protein